VFETVILQAIAHARMRQRITSTSAYFDYMRVTDTIDFPEVGRPWHHWKNTENAASDNQSAANAIANILLSHRQNPVRLMHELLLFSNSWPKNVGAAHTRVRLIHAQIRYVWNIYLMKCSFWQLMSVVQWLSCLPLDPRFAGSNPAEDDGL
jgi:hypothetical protein